MYVNKIPLLQISDPKPKSPELDTRTRWQIFSAAPHRMMFFGGFLQVILTVLWWSIELCGRYTTWWSPLATAMPSTWLHALLMTYTLPIFFIFAFLMTTYPRWMNGQPVPYRAYTTSFFLLCTGVIITYLGLFINQWVIVTGLLLFLAGWARGFFALWHVYKTTSPRSKRYETLFNCALVAGWFNLLFSLLAIITTQGWLIVPLLQTGIWLLLVPIFVGVCHRMLPFFSSTVIPNYRVVQPNWSIPVLAVCSVGHAILSLSPTVWAWRLIVDLPLMFLVFHHSYYWGLRQSLSIRLLAMLHIAFVWLGIALLLYNVQSIWLLMTQQLILDKAPLHALTIGFMLSLIVGMVSRVALGHSGRPLVTDHLTWYCFWGVSIIAILRILAEIPYINMMLGIHLNIWVALLWLMILIPWVSHYLPITLKPRVDGQPG